MQVYRQSPEGTIAILLLEKAIGQIKDGEDALPTIAKAEAALRVEAGEMDPEEIEEINAVRG